MGSISLKGIAKTFAGNAVALRDINLDVEDGEFVVFVGPSGCGKSTLLRIIAGLEDSTEGEVRINGNVVNDVAARDRDVAMVFQSYALYPQMTVRQNIAFALELRNLSKSEIAQRVAEAARILDLTEFLDRKPGQLSGGQRQRVAMGRAIVRNPQAFLLDEPLSNLDAKLRVQLRAELGRLHAKLGTTTIHVTHDQVEAMTLGSRVAVFSRGSLQQYDSPHALYHAPANIFVAGFIGSPAMNFLQGQIVSAGVEMQVAVGGITITVHPKQALLQFTVGQSIIIGIRPEHLRWRLAAHQIGLGAEVTLIEKLEPESFVALRLTDPTVSIRMADDYVVGRPIEPAELLRAETRFVTMRVSANALPPANTPLHLMIDGAQVHLFDIQTGIAL